MFMPGLAPDALGLGVHQDFARAIETLDHRFVILTTSAGAMAVPEEIVSLPEARRWRGLASLLAPVLRTRALVPAAVALATYLRRQGDAIDCYTWRSRTRRVWRSPWRRSSPGGPSRA